MEQMSAEVVFEEHTPFFLFLFIMLSMAIIFIVLLIVQIFIGPVGSRPAPNWIFIVFISIFLFLSIAFWRYSVVLTSEYIQVGFPLYHVRISWEDICSVKKAENIPAYAGYGIILIKYNGSWIRAFNMPQMEKLLLDVKGRKYSRLLISVKNSERVISYIRQKGERSRKNCE